MRFRYTASAFSGVLFTEIQWRKKATDEQYESETQTVSRDLMAAIEQRSAEWNEIKNIPNEEKRWKRTLKLDRGRVMSTMRRNRVSVGNLHGG